MKMFWEDIYALPMTEVTESSLKFTLKKSGAIFQITHICRGNADEIQAFKWVQPFGRNRSNLQAANHDSD